MIGEFVITGSTRTRLRVSGNDHRELVRIGFDLVQCKPELIYSIDFLRIAFAQPFPEHGLSRFDRGLIPGRLDHIDEFGLVQIALQ